MSLKYLTPDELKNILRKYNKHFEECQETCFEDCVECFVDSFMKSKDGDDNNVF